VARIAKAKGLSRLSALDQRIAIVRYEKKQPGEMIHIDIKKLGRIDKVGHRITGDRTGQSAPRSRKEGKGWEYLHLAVDDHSRLAYSEILPDETRRSCLKFLFNALRFFRDHGVKVLPVMTDNGVSFRSLSSPKGVANAENQAQARQTPHTKNKPKGRALRADLLAGMGEAGQRFQRAKPVGMAGGGLRQTLQSFIRRPDGDILKPLPPCLRLRGALGPMRSPVIRCPVPCERPGFLMPMWINSPGKVLS
jgi:hypothetical protein